jgi:hypothetical protein
VSRRAIGLATGVTRGWVRAYTRGLSADLRSARRAELDSDLWEHAEWRAREGRQDGRIALEIVARLVAGMAADLSWRVEHRAERQKSTRRIGGGSMIGLLKQNGMFAFAGAFGVTVASLAVVIASVGDVELLQTAIMFVAGLLVVVGLVAVRRGLPGGRPAVALGAIVPGLLLVWTVVMPIVSLTILIWLYGGSRARTGPARPA